ncbi:MAG: tRNA lysidine(34) synthetase TilS [Candidatus Delongbacteria bacterium]|nr:tRNA lysidine(34) synthetase TilS [Candidatus Delongbacteria bacterium]
MPDNNLKQIVAKSIQDIPGYTVNLKLAVSYSGGIDSGVLLDTVLSLYKSGKISQPEVIYFNHNWRGEESIQEKQFIENKFKNTDIDLSVIDLDVNKLSEEKNISIEFAARELRYFHLENIAKEVDYILLGHHRDDNIETVFFNFLRGSGLNGLEGIKKIRGKYLRPLLGVSKEEIIEYAEKNNIEYVTDSSNSKDEFSRNKIRNNIIPFIENELNRKVKGSIQNLSQNIAEVNEYFDGIITEYFLSKENAVNINKSLWLLNRDMFIQESIIIQKLAINHCLKTMNMSYNLDQKSTQAIIEHIREKKENILEFFGHKIEVFGNNIIILGPDFFKDNSTSITVLENVSKFYFDPAKITELKYDIINLEDEFTPFGKTNPEKIRKVLSDKKIPKIFRENLKVILDGNRVIFIQGVGISDYIKSDENTVEKKFISVENNYLENLFL